jgi:uncharacterized protein YbjT (DUF2867 family)
MGPRAVKVLSVGARRVAEAVRSAGVRRVAVLSIVNVDRSTYGYYRAKAEQEQAYLSGDVVPPAVTVVRATQFHSFLEMFFGPGGRLGAWSRLGFLPVPRGARFQPIDLTDVARALVDSAMEAGPSRTWSIGGPRTLDARDMAKEWRRAHGSHRRVVGVPMPGAIGAFFREGLNLLPDDHYERVTYAEWLTRSSGEHGV